MQVLRVPTRHLTSHSCGTAVSNFTSADVLAGLKNNASADVEWVAGIKHPTFSWDKWHISADYTAVDAAIEKANALNENDYRDFSAVKAALDAVVRGKNITEQAKWMQWRRPLRTLSMLWFGEAPAAAALPAIP